MYCDHSPNVAGDCACGAYRENIRQQYATIEGLLDKADALEDEARDLRERAREWKKDLDETIIYARRNAP